MDFGSKLAESCFFGVFFDKNMVVFALYQKINYITFFENRRCYGAKIWYVASPDPLLKIWLRNFKNNHFSQVYGAVNMVHAQNRPKFHGFWPINPGKMKIGKIPLSDF